MPWVSSPWAKCCARSSSRSRNTSRILPMPWASIIRSSRTRAMTENNPDLQQEIATLAHRYWEEDGCPEDRAVQHWDLAEREIRRRRGLAPADCHAPGGIPEDTGASGKLG